MSSFLISLFIVSLISSLTFSNPLCDQHGVGSCMQNGTDYFMQRYNDIHNKIPVTDVKWEKDLLAQCEIDQSGRKCLAEFIQHCAPKGTTTNQLLIVFASCSEKVKNITSGCKPNSSAWYTTCETPLVEQLYIQMTTNPKAHPFSALKLEQIHKRVCCETKRYAECITAKAANECSPTGQDVFRGAFNDMYIAYQCSPSIVLASDC